jgi:hypothetical protein
MVHPVHPVDGSMKYDISVSVFSFMLKKMTCGTHGSELSSTLENCGDESSSKVTDAGAHTK